MSLWYYDAAGVVRTKEELSIIDDFEKFAAIIVAFGLCDAARWGALPGVIAPPPAGPHSRSVPLKTLTDCTINYTDPYTKYNVCITLLHFIFAAYAMTGRRTFVYAAIANPDISNGLPLIAKFSYQLVTRRKEHEIVELARSKNVPHIPEIYGHADLWKLSQGLREEIKNKAGKDGFYDDRILRMVVYKQYFPLKDLFSKSLEHMHRMAVQILDGTSSLGLYVKFTVLTCLQVCMVCMILHESCIVMSL